MAKTLQQSQGACWTKANYAIEFMRRAYWHAQGGICPICGNKMVGKVSSSKLNFDHVWPVSKLGTEPLLGFRGNLLLVHLSCNSEKADRQPTQVELKWLSLVNERLNIPLDARRAWEGHRDTA